MLMSELKIEFNPNDYSEVPFFHGKYNLTYHNFLKDMEYELVDLTDDQTFHGNGTDFLRDVGECSKIIRWTKYH